MDGIIDFGIALIQSIQTLPAALDIPMEFFTFMGTIEFYMIFITFIFWIVNPRLGFQTLFLLMTVDFVSASFKQLLHQPRPYWVGGVESRS